MFGWPREAVRLRRVNLPSPAFEIVQLQAPAVGAAVAAVRPSPANEVPPPVPSQVASAVLGGGRRAAEPQ